MVVDFTAAWCGPCKALAPLYEKLSAKYGSRMTFLKVDVDQNQEIAREYEIRAMPTFVFYAKGKEVDRVQGADPSKLENLIQKYQDLQPTFAGMGRKLSDAPSPSAAPSATAETPPAAVDESKPTTTLQIRTADGSRLLAKFNMDSTVGELRSHIRHAGGGKGPTAFVLMAGVPPKRVTEDDSATLEEAGLLGSVIIQRSGN